MTEELPTSGTVDVIAPVGYAGSWVQVIAPTPAAKVVYVEALDLEEPVDVDVALEDVDDIDGFRRIVAQIALSPDAPGAPFPLNVLPFSAFYVRARRLSFERAGIVKIRVRLEGA
jgi:hypothetical protein